VRAVVLQSITDSHTLFTHTALSCMSYIQVSYNSGSAWQSLSWPKLARPYQLLAPVGFAAARAAVLGLGRLLHQLRLPSTFWCLDCQGSWEAKLLLRRLHATNPESHVW